MNLNLSHVTANPIVLTSAIFAVLGWLLMFIGACTAGFKGLIWWILTYELLLQAGLYLILAKAQFAHYRLVILVFLGVSIAQLTVVIDRLVQYSKPAEQATAAGALDMIVMQFFWVFIFGSSQDAWVHQAVYGLQAARRPLALDSPVTQGKEQLDIEARSKAGSIRSQSTMDTPKYFAMALHPYDANPEDPNELSFVKNEILEITDRNGNWWHAKKHDSTEGIVPSNYFCDPQPHVA